MKTVEKVIPDPSELKIALDNRAFEIQLFWQRSNYFLVLITALGIGVFSIGEPLFSLVISVAATTSSYFWFRTNLGSRFWQESWEAEVVLLANELGIRSFQRPLDQITDQVDRELSRGNNKTMFRAWIDVEILKKPSVSYYMIRLSLASIILWTFVSAIYAYKIRLEFYTMMDSLFNYACNSSFYFDFAFCLDALPIG